jgi:Zn-dependent protease
VVTLRAMRSGIHLGRLAGFPIRLGWSFLLLLAIVALTMGGLGGVFLVLLTFGSVLLHELGHALVARRLGVRIAGIELHFLGGAALMVDPPRSARDEIAIAAAGPAVSLMLAGLGFGLGQAFGASILTHLGWVNLILAVFNLIPALPMDGGRILRAVLARRASFARATETAVKVSRVFAVLFAVAAVALGHFQLALIAALVWFLGTAELRNIPHGAYRDEVEVLPPLGFPRGPWPRGTYRVVRWDVPPGRW